MRQGYVEWVDAYPARSFLAADAAAAQATLVVQDGEAFVDATQVTVAGTVYTIASLTLGVGEDDPAVLTLTTNLSALVGLGEPVNVFPEVVTTWAGVVRADEVDSITVRVPQSSQLTLPLGVREEADREVVAYDDGADGPEIVSIEGRAEVTGIVNATGGVFTGDVTISDTGNLYIVDNGQLINWGPARYGQVQNGEIVVGALVGGVPANPKVRHGPQRISWERDDVTSSVWSQTSGLFTVDAGTDLLLRATDGLEVRALGGDIALEASGRVYSTTIALTTGGAAPNMVVNNSTGTLYRSTSSRRYKDIIADFTLDDRDLLSLTARRYYDKGEVERWVAGGRVGDHPRVYCNLIAEELHEAGFTEFVAYDDHDRPDNIYADRLVVVLLEHVKLLDTRLRALEASA